METEVTELNLAVGSEQELNFHLHLGRVKQKVEVGETAAGVELSRSASGDVVRGTEIRILPLNGRSWTDLAALEPAVAPIEAQVSYTPGNRRGNTRFCAQLASAGGRR